MDVFYVRHHIPDPGLAYGYAFCPGGGRHHRGSPGSVSDRQVRPPQPRGHLGPPAAHHRRQRPPPTLPMRTCWKNCARCGAGIRAKLEICISELLLRVQGTARIRLSGLALELGLVHKWVREYRSRRAFAPPRRRQPPRDIGRRRRHCHGPCSPSRTSTTRLSSEASRALLRNAEEPQLAWRLPYRRPRIAAGPRRPYRIAAALCPHIMRRGAAEALAQRRFQEPSAFALEIVARMEEGPACRQSGDAAPALRSGCCAAPPSPSFPNWFPRANSRRIFSFAIGDESEIVRAAAAEAAGKLQLIAALPALKEVSGEWEARRVPSPPPMLWRAFGPEGCGHSRRAGARLALHHRLGRTGSSGTGALRAPDGGHMIDWQLLFYRFFNYFGPHDHCLRRRHQCHYFFLTVLGFFALRRYHARLTAEQTRGADPLPRWCRRFSVDRFRHTTNPSPSARV